MFNKHALNTLTVAFVLCLVCSVLVSSIAVGLKPIQERNKLLDRNKNILSAAGLYDRRKHTNDDVQALFEQFSVHIVNLNEGRFSTTQELQTSGIDLQTYEERRGARNPDISKSLRGNDPAGILRRAHYATVYILEEAGSIELLVLPVRGAGLWGPMNGFLVLEGDLNTIRGLAFYDHKETPGLGAKVDDQQWKDQWPGKSAFDDQGDIAVEVVKGRADADNEIDGLSGATLTTRGVDQMIKFWLGERGFAKFLDKLQAGEA